MMNPNKWADFWRYEIGVNTIPANTKTKTPLVSWTNDSRGNWQTQPIPEEIHKQWKKDNLFKDGLAIICGQVFHNEKYAGLWLNGIDCDDKAGIDAICPSGIEQASRGTLVEQHGNKEKCHVLCYSKQPLKNRSLISDAPKIEIKSMGKNLLYCAGGIHKDGSLIDIVGTRKIKVIDSTDLERQLDKILKPFEKSRTNLISQIIPVEEKIANLPNKVVGTNKQGDLLSIVTSFAVRAKGIVTEDDCIKKSVELSRQFVDEPYDEKKAARIGKSAFAYSINDEDKKKNEIDLYRIAEQLIEKYHFITLAKSNEILFYKSGKYRTGGEEIIQKRTRKLAKNIKLHHINEIKGIIRDETGYVSPDDFDKDSHIINTKQGLFDLKKGIMRDHSPDYLSRVQVPVHFDPNAICPRFEKFLDSSLENDERKIRTVLEMMSLCFIKDNALVQKAFMNTGKGSNGKSILFGILLSLLGKENSSAKTLHDFERNRFSLSALEGKLANICADVGNKGITETETLKKIIAGDPLDCERKFMEGYTFFPYATLIFSANDIPTVEDESDGFARRFELIEWKKSFYGNDRDNTVKTIKNDPQELSGIFNKLVPIARDLLKHESLKFESTVEDAKNAWLRKSDSSKRFIDELLARGSEYYCPVSIVWNSYNRFCKENGMTPLNDRSFNKKLEVLGLERMQKKIGGINTRCWLGICLRSELRGGNQSL